MISFNRLRTGCKENPTRAALILVVTIGAISGATVIGVAAYREHALRNLLAEVLPGVSRAQPLVYDDGTLRPAAYGSGDEDAIFAGYDADGRLIGYAIPGEGPGYQDMIRVLYGYRPESRRIVGLAILDSGESPGWGDKIDQNRAFMLNFQGLAVDPEIQVVGQGEKQAPNQVDMITGATISSQAVVQIVNAANRRWLKLLPRAGHEPAARER
jgi:electron transport complex protein RnfG